MKKDFVNVPCWSIHKWVNVLVKGGGQKRRFQYCVNPNYPHQFLYLRVIEGHSGSTIDPALQDNMLLAEDFTEFIYHVGNGKELRSIVNNGLTQGGVRLETSRYAVMRLVHCKNRAIQKYLETTSGYIFLVQFIARSRKRTAILPHKVHCGRPLWHTACRMKAICMKAKEQFYQRESARPRVVLRANSQCE